MKGFVDLLFMLFGAMFLGCLFNSLMVWTHQTAAFAPYDIGTNVNEMRPNPG